MPINTRKNGGVNLPNLPTTCVNLYVEGILVPLAGNVAILDVVNSWF